VVDKWGSSQKKATVHLVMDYSTVSKLLATPRLKTPNRPPDPRTVRPKGVLQSIADYPAK
jgi:hypothetical protein